MEIKTPLILFYVGKKINKVRLDCMILLTSYSTTRYNDMEIRCFTCIC